MDHVATPDRIRAGAVALSAIFMVGSNAVNAMDVAAMAGPPRPGVIDPATWAFAIWGLIFLLALVSAGYQLLPRNLDRPLPRAIGWPLAAAFLLTGSWPIAVVADQLNVAQILLTTMWALLAVVFLHIAGTPAVTTPDRWFIALPVAPFFGWLTAANPVSLFSRLTDLGIVAPNGAGNLVGIGLLFGAALVAAWFVREGQRGPLLLWGPYALTIAWAIVAIIANQPALTSLGAVGALVVAVPVVVAVLGGLSGPGGPFHPAAGPSPA
jgi:hypothetical protein